MRAGSIWGIILWGCCMVLGSSSLLSAAEEPEVLLGAEGGEEPGIIAWWEDFLTDGILAGPLGEEKRGFTIEELRAWDELLESTAGEMGGQKPRVLSAEERQQALEEQESLAMLRAVFEQDGPKLQELLQQGASPNRIVPKEVPRDILQKAHGDSLHYYLTQEGNVSMLMLAAAMGYREGVDILLRAGADRWIKTRRHKTYALWLAAQTGDVELMRLLMGLDPQGEWQRHSVRVDLAAQQMVMQREGAEVFRSPISSGKKSKPTKSGQFLVTDKHRDWKSSIYRVPMPYFVRLSCSDFGFHAGRLPGYPASSGCIRLPAEKAKEFFDLVPLGTLVVIE